MNCQNCGTEFSGNICPRCGAQMQKLEQQSQQPVTQQGIQSNQPPVIQQPISAYQKENTIAEVLQFVGWITIVIGGGIFLCMSLINETPIFLIGVVVCAILGLIWLGFAEAIHLLQKINDQNAAMLEWMKRHESSTIPMSTDNTRK